MSLSLVLDLGGSLAAFLDLTFTILALNSHGGVIAALLVAARSLLTTS
jgi:hypothetical protein